MRLLLIDDETDFAQEVVRGLRHHGYAVDLAYDGEEGWGLATVNEYDLVILDLNLPILDGMEVCHRLRTSHPLLLILMLTARSQPHERVAGLDVGADDYLVKPFHFTELLARIRALLRRDLRARSSLFVYKDLRLDSTARVAWLDHRRLNLTRKEFGILEYLLRRQGETSSQETLLEHVWDMHADTVATTVRVHINSLRRKLSDLAEKPKYIETVIGQGYRIGSLDLEEMSS
jgi:DNA-binding response OmpR family regulator